MSSKFLQLEKANIFSKFISTEGISLPLVDKIPLFSKHQVYTGTHGG